MKRHWRSLSTVLVLMLAATATATGTGTTTMNGAQASPGKAAGLYYERSPAALAPSRESARQADVPVTVHSIGRNGAPPVGGIGQLIDIQSGVMIDLPFDASGTAKVTIAEGVYNLTVLSQTKDPDGGKDQVTLMTQPKVRVDNAIELTADARAGKPFVTDVDAEDAKVTTARLSMRNGPRDLGVTITAHLLDHPIYAVPAESADTDHDFKFAVRQVLNPPSGAAKNYQYNLVYDGPHGIPEDLCNVVHDDELAALDTTYSFPDDPNATRTDDALLRGNERGGSPPDLSLVMPAKRTEFYTAHADVTWIQTLIIGAKTYERKESFQPGKAEREWKPDAIR